MDEKCKISVASINVDGFQGNVVEVLVAWLKKTPHAIVCLQETKCDAKTMTKLMSSSTLDKDYTWILNSHSPRNMHGVAMLIHKTVKFESLPCAFDPTCPVRSDNQSKTKDPTCGRVQCISVQDRFCLVNVYCPNAGSDPRKPLKHLEYRIKHWDPALAQFLNTLSSTRKKPVLCMGDWNVAPTELDVTDAIKMDRWAGFTKEERANFYTLLTQKDWTDVWRKKHPKDRGYTWRGRSGINRMRFDLALANSLMTGLVGDALILSDEQWKAETDHVPLVVSF